MPPPSGQEGAWRRELRPVSCPVWLAYWSRSSGDWFSHDPGFDRDFRTRYLDLHERTRSGALDHWQADARGDAGALILLDQFPRNAFRGSARMYADRPAGAPRRADRHGPATSSPALPEPLRMFLMLPFSHSEDAADHDLSVALHERFLPGGLGRARRHRDIIRRFGRFPHRNGIWPRQHPGRAGLSGEWRVLWLIPLQIQCVNHRLPNMTDRFDLA